MNDDQQYSNYGPNQYWYGGGPDNNPTAASNANFPPPLTPPPPPHLPDYRTMQQNNPPKNNSRLRTLFIGFVVVLLLILIGTGFYAFNYFRTHNQTQQAASTGTSTSVATSTQTGDNTILVTTHPTIIVDNSSGSITAHAGEAKDRVTLKFTKASSSSSVSTGNTYVPFNETSDKNTIVISIDPANAGDLDITLPTTSTIKFVTNSGNIIVSGIHGQMDLLTNSGSITVTHSTVTTASLLNDNSGDIKATQTNFDGNITVKNNSGTITFEGSLGSTGTYQFLGNGGLIDLTLPRSSAFHLNAATNSNTIRSNFPGIQDNSNKDQADIGNSPQASLILYNNSGSIAFHVQQGS